LDPEAPPVVYDAPPVDQAASPGVDEPSSADQQVPDVGDVAPPQPPEPLPPPAEERQDATTPGTSAAGRPPRSSNTPLPPPAGSSRAPWRPSGVTSAPLLSTHSRGISRPRGPRSLLTRLVAVLALAAVIAAVVLLVRSLSSSKHSKAVTSPAAVRVLIPEGKNRIQIAQIAAKAGLTGSYRTAAKRSARLNPTSYGAPAGTPDLEGFLFPATYDMTPGAPASRLVDDQLAAFKENFGAQEAARARALHVTPYQLLTVASMIEREAQVPADRAKIAAVIYNRLHQGMPLGIDATIYYAVEMRKGIGTYTHELTEAQLHIDSPYNTRTHTGLPPTPISNPGLASIQAAARPTHASYLYYVAAADGCGAQVFSSTLAAFEANAAAYQAAVRRNGGHPPTCKKK
jgi:UPF0755 protein